jgi:uncharacterized membrane protein
MATPPTSDAPFGLQPNVAAGLAYLLGLIGGIIMLVGGGTNRAVKWAAAQSITMWGLYIVLWFAISFIAGLTHIGVLFFLLPIMGLLWFVLWLWTSITAFQGKDVKVPVIAGVTESLFKGSSI